MILPLNPRAISDQLIAVAYLAIPLALLASAVARRHIMHRSFRDPANLLLLLFAAFILSCGIGHQIDAYFISNSQCAAFTSLKTWWNWVTASLSVLTALVLVPMLPTYVILLYKPIDIEAMRRRIKELEGRINGR